MSAIADKTSCPFLKHANYLGIQMKKLLAIVLLAISFGAFAEASFDEIEGLIRNKNYAAAASGLEGIIANHPKSAKAFYAMAQAQAGLGNLEKANKALTIATGLNPSLDFAPEGSVQKLKEAITPQQAKIEAVEDSHVFANILIALALAIFVSVGFLWFKQRQEEQTAKEEADREEFKRRMRQAADDHVKSVNAQPIKPATPSASYASSYTPRPAYSGNTSSVSSTPSVTPAPTVVNNHYGSSNDGLLTGILIGDMMNSHHHDTTRVVEREVIREVPAPSRDSSWDDTPSRSNSRSSSWDDDSSSRSSSRSSSWDSDSSSSSSSSSWSSSSSDSSSSWDSGSSSSDSSSSWD